MSLYEGLDFGGEEKKETAETQWSVGLKLLHSQIQLKRATQTSQVKKEKAKLVSLVPSSVAVGPPPPVFPAVTRKPDGAAVRVDSGAFEPYSPLSFLGDGDGGSNKLFGEIFVKNEYNPQYPSDFFKEVERLKQQAASRRHSGTDAVHKRRKMEEADAISHSNKYEPTEEEGNNSGRSGAAIAPPPSLIQEDSKAAGESGTFAAQSRTSKNEKGANVAAKIMQKYGYRQGQGLGKAEQGMSTALIVERTSKRGGKIIHEKDVSPLAKASVAPTAVEPITELLKCPTKVILLRNMISPGEVDDDLEGEIQEELTKYGQVTKVTIFEGCFLKIGDRPEDEAVRIFVEFAKMEQAVKAVVDLNGRYFGGRMVAASFFDFGKYQNLELTD